MKFFFRTLIFSLLALNVYAQDVDSVTFAHIKWEKEKIAKKTLLFTTHVKDSSLFSSNQYISFVEVKDHRKAPGFFIGYDQKKLIETSVFGKQYKAISALNGTFFDIKNGGSVDFIKVNDTIINPNRLEKNNNRALHQKAALVINNYHLAIKKWDGSQEWESNLTDQNIMLSGPLLLLDSEKEKMDSVPFNKLRHPRSAIGIKPNGSVLLLTVDGRQENSAGVSLFELTKIMKWLGCSSAINLDGGGSTTLWVDGIGENGVVNHPSDNKKWDHEGERKVANVIFIKSKAKQ
ncbi:phosphodiester glycosidase family protein [Pedobacter sp. ASV28]|uniref:phosphodiester glycosidase family protein n=1 Tax=Pedobacter sp. ASV28 TaxID=2795123 RepID=UPI0018EE023B|nr:phosphodiester glycosidase family protein [Pedobacter sp. ASV28]